ncbi:sodium:solute symporter family protein [Halolamina sediminis]|uniref:sodium:solute symporter family protein n=1 Tax=Halolamina sediminis TaxID=1480675 RepID=UPI0006B61E4E|nr:sodium:solute symporter family protein [Halolamina sediminis]
MLQSAVSIQIGIVVAYLLLALGVGLVAYRLTDRTAEDYYLASRTLGTVVLLFTTFATLLSAFTFFAGPNIAYGNGPEWILVMGLMDGVIFGVLWYVVGYKQWLVGKAHGYVTLGEMLGDRFGSPLLRGLVAGVSLFWLFPYVMLQQVGAGGALSALTEGAVPYWAGAGLITAFMIVYVVLSGMRGVAWTDTLQGLFMLTMVWAAFVWVLSAVGGVGAATDAIASSNPEFLSLGGGVYSPQWMLSQAIGIAFGVAMFPQVNQRFFVADSEKVLKRTMALWPIVVLLLFVPAFMLGAWAAGLGVPMPESGNILPGLLAEYTPTWFAALVVAGAMAAMMSSSDSMLLSGSSYFTRDLYRPFVNADASERREDLIARIGVAVFATLAFLASLYNPPSLFVIGDTAFGGFAQLAPPVIVALYWSRTTLWGMLAGILGSQLFYTVTTFTPPAGETTTVLGVVVPGVMETFGGWSSSVVGMVVGLVLVVGVSLVTDASVAERPSVLAGPTDD